MSPSDATLDTDKAPFARYQDFQIELVGERLDLVEDYHAWRDGSRFSFMTHWCVLDTAMKARILHVQSLVSQRERQEQAVREHLFGGGGGRFSPHLTIEVSRDNIVEDSMRALSQVTTSDLRKPLRVSFEGEEGIDEGGVRKEWFQLLVSEIFDPKYGMFAYNAQTRAHWFRRESEDLLYFNLMGTLLGMAIYNDVILDLHFPSVVYKLLLGRNAPPITFDDLAEVDEELHSGLRTLLDFDGDVSETFERAFEAEFERFGEACSEPLVPHGAAVPLTNANRRNYVRVYARHQMIDAVQKQWGAFHRGFKLVLDDEATKMFVWQELKQLICGSDDLDMHELERGARYDSNYSAEHPTVRLLWEVVHSFDDEQKRRFLRFATGSDRAPIGGLYNIRLVIVWQAWSADAPRLPSAHTCFSQLILPAYPDKETLQQKLLLAMENDTGFGML